MNTVAVYLTQRPTGLPGPECFTVREAPVATPGEGEVLVAVRMISLDPAMRGWMNEGRSYIPPVPLDTVMRALAVGEIIESRAPGFDAGDWVRGAFGVQSHCVISAKGLSKIDPALAPPARWLGGLGMPGMTAYFGLLDVCAHREGDVVLVSAANGAVGSVVGQLAKARGSQVIGIAGGPEKCRHVVETYGFDACIDYKSEPVGRRIRELAPNGIDVYFDNVGGETLEAALANLHKGARIGICGAIGDYNDMARMKGPRNYLNLLVDSARMQGFVIFDYAARYTEAEEALTALYRDGKLVLAEHVEKGLTRFPEVLAMLFDGRNTAKLVLEV